MRTAKEQAFFEQGIIMGSLISEKDFVMDKQMTPTSNPGSVQARIDRTLQGQFQARLDKAIEEKAATVYHMNEMWVG